MKPRITLLALFTLFSGLSVWALTGTGQAGHSNPISNFDPNGFFGSPRDGVRDGFHDRLGADRNHDRNPDSSPSGNRDATPDCSDSPGDGRGLINNCSGGGDATPDNFGPGDGDVSLRNGVRQDGSGGQPDSTPDQIIVIDRAGDMAKDGDGAGAHGDWPGGNTLRDRVRDNLGIDATPDDPKRISHDGIKDGIADRFNSDGDGFGSNGDKYPDWYFGPSSDNSPDGVSSRGVRNKGKFDHSLASRDANTDGPVDRNWDLKPDRGGYGFGTVTTISTTSTTTTTGATSTTTTSTTSTTGVTTTTTSSTSTTAVSTTTTSTTFSTSTTSPPPSFVLTIDLPLGTGSGTVDLNPPGSPTVCLAIYMKCRLYSNGTLVAMTPVPSGGSVFSGWSGDPDCLDAKLTMDAGKLCTPMFNLIPSTTTSTTTFSTTTTSPLSSTTTLVNPVTTTMPSSSVTTTTVGSNGDSNNDSGCSFAENGGHGPAGLVLSLILLMTPLALVRVRRVALARKE